jgi:hypothetical protein
MHDHGRLVAFEALPDRSTVADVPVDAHDGVARAKDRAASPVDVEPYDPSPDRNKVACEPAAEEPGGTGDEDSAATPEPVVYCHVTQGARPDSQMLRSVRSSRRVSTHCQKSSWR